MRGEIDPDTYARWRATTLGGITERLAAELVFSLAEMARVTRPGGRVILGELHRWSLWAAKRRRSAALHGGAWEGVHFWSKGQLRGLARGVGLHVDAAALSSSRPRRAALASPSTSIPGSVASAARGRL